jgi:hypothetical protein
LTSGASAIRIFNWTSAFSLKVPISRTSACYTTSANARAKFASFSAHATYSCNHSLVDNINLIDNDMGTVRPQIIRILM